MKYKMVVRNGKEFREKQEKTQWIFYPYLARRHITALTSQTGGGKSYLATWWAMKLSNAGKKVLYVDAYQDDLTRDRFYKFQTIGKMNPDYVKFYADKVNIEKFIKSIEGRRYDVVIIDAFVLVAGFKEHHLKYVKMFKDAAVRSNASFLLLFNAFGDKHISVAYDNNDKPVELIDYLFITTLLLVSYKGVEFKNLISTGFRERIKRKDKYDLSLELFDDRVKFSFKKDSKGLKAVVFPYWEFVLNV